MADEGAAAVEYLKQWKISNVTRPARLFPKDGFDGAADRNYNLKNRSVRKFLQHEVQPAGINLGWTDDAEPDTAREVSRWLFARAGDDERALVYGETLALAVGEPPSFIRYKRRPNGINLVYSSTPAFEWQLGGGSNGQSIDATNIWPYITSALLNAFYFLTARVRWPTSVGRVQKPYRAQFSALSFPRG